MDKSSKDIENKTNAITTNSIAKKVKGIVVDILALVHSNDAESSTKPKKDITSKRANLFMEALGLGEDGMFYAGKMYTPEQVVKIVSAILKEISLCPDKHMADIANEAFFVVGIKDRYLDSHFQVWRSTKSSLKGK